ncbi:MAG: NADPH-dependent FMN reductase [Bacteroidota bacterium]
MSILTISGSSREESANVKLLDALSVLFAAYEFKRYHQINHLPLFSANKDKAPYDESIIKWRTAVSTTDALIICTPEYIHNLPAVLKNALEWLTTSGELMGKPVLPITFTPHEPRGKKAMQSLIWSLQALEARVITQLPMYQNEVTFDDEGKIVQEEIVELLKAAVEILGISYP